MSQIFISYHRQDSEFAENLHHRLKETGFKVWRDIELLGGDDWRQEIDNAIKEAFALIVIMSPEARVSEYVTYEWAYAYGAGIKVIPILFKDTKIHPRLESLHYLNFTNRDARPWDKLNKLLKDASNIVKKEPESISNKVINNDWEQTAYKKMILELKEKGFNWRNLETIALKGGVTEEEALKILRREPNIEFGKHSSGVKIVRLNT